jgi:DNA-binding response OmpR family regulator
MKVLVVEDEPKLGEFLKANLTGEGYGVDLAFSFKEASALLKENTYSLLLLDLRLPDGDGLNLIDISDTATPVIILTAVDALEDRVRGLKAGADDYICKPFAHEELIARIEAVLRRPGRAMGHTLRAGAIEFDTVNLHVQVHGIPLRLPRRELAALELLMRGQGRVIMRDTLEAALYTIDDMPSSNAIEANISRLRRRLGLLKSGVDIQVARGLGYILTVKKNIP